MVFPDHEDGVSAARAALRAGLGDKVLAHASGRPWITGSWDDADVLTASAGNRRIALLGCFRATAEDLARALGRTDDPGSLDEVLRAIPGSYHTIASFDGRLRVQGSLSSVREVFHASVGGLTLAADRPDTLAALAGGGVDTTTLVCHLLLRPPWPLSERTAWRGVTCLGPGHYLSVLPDGSHRCVRWWTPPPAEQPLEAAAQQVRAALRDAVAARTRTSAVVGCDLSGGMDSTSLAFLAAADERCRRLVTVRREAEDPANDDAAFARRAGGFLPHAESLVLSRSQVPYSFAGQLALDDDLEAPYPWRRVRAVAARVAGELAERGVPVHMTGHGGDELFYPAPSFFHALAHARPLRSVRDLRVARSMYRWPLGALVRTLLHRPTYSQWLHTASRTLTTPVAGPTEPFPGWGFYPRLPAWATGEAVGICRGLLREAAERGAAPLSRRPAQHETLQAARQCGTRIRLTDRLTARSGVAYHAPYLDDEVLRAALSVRIEDRSHPHRTKPVLATAMRGIVPDPVLDRTTRGEFSAEVYTGTRRHLGELLELADDMRLARLGLVDGAAVRSVLLSPHPMARTFTPMVSTLACEAWLRSVEAAGARTAGLEGIR
nr:asparagine synthase-related protein [Streptomyces harenosi]